MNAKATHAGDDRFVKQVVKVENGVATVVSVESHGPAPVSDAWRRKAIVAERERAAAEVKVSALPLHRLLSQLESS